MGHEKQNRRDAECRFEDHDIILRLDVSSRHCDAPALLAQFAAVCWFAGNARFCVACTANVLD